MHLSVVDAHLYALLLVLEVLGEGCSEAFGNWGTLSKVLCQLLYGRLDFLVLATTENCNVGTVLVQPGGDRLWLFLSEQ